MLWGVRRVITWMIKCRQEEKEVRETHQLLLNAEMD
jgi:hypothetical protein